MIRLMAISPDADMQTLKHHNLVDYGLSKAGFASGVQCIWKPLGTAVIIVIRDAGRAPDIRLGSL